MKKMMNYKYCVHVNQGGYLREEVCATSEMDAITQAVNKHQHGLSKIVFNGTTLLKGWEVRDIRIFQHDTEDQIRIGESFPIPCSCLKEIVEKTINLYSEKLAWCGGFQAGCEKYYKRIALVDAETFQSVVEIYPGKEAK